MFSSYVFTVDSPRHALCCDCLFRRVVAMFAAKFVVRAGMGRGVLRRFGSGGSEGDECAG